MGYLIVLCFLKQFQGNSGFGFSMWTKFNLFLTSELKPLPPFPLGFEYSLRLGRDEQTAAPELEES
jgi:hypothetical protein